MMVAQYFVEFIFYSFLGWIWESIYCTIKEKHWADRGFLFGPICPIYGSSVVAASLIFEHIHLGGATTEAPWWLIFIICYVGSAIAEFGTSWVLEKRFHMRWWDYSKMPLNIQGRICVPVSMAFGAAGIVVVKVVLPFMSAQHAVVPAVAYEVMAILMAMVFGADYALTEASMSALLKNIEQMHAEFNQSAEARYERLAAAPGIIAEKLQEAPGNLVDRIQEAPKALEEKWEMSQNAIEEVARTIAERNAGRLSFNQKRILGSVQKYTPKRFNGKLTQRTSVDYMKDYIFKKKSLKTEAAKETQKETAQHQIQGQTQEQTADK